MNMNSLERKVLKQKTMTLVGHGVLTEDFKDELRESGVFPDHMLAAIMAGKTIQERTSRMLELLPTRGPTAFNTFLDIVGKDYWWLQREIRDSLENEEKTEIENVTTANNYEVLDFRSGISSLMHRRFGQSRKVSEKDKQAIEKWLTDVINEERTLWRKRLEEQKQSAARRHQESLEYIVSLIEIANIKLEGCLYNLDSGKNNAEIQKNKQYAKPEDAMVYLDHNINALRERLKSMAEDQEKCLEAVSMTLNVPNEGKNNCLSPRVSQITMPIYEEVKKMKREYEQRIRHQEEEKDSKIVELEYELDLLVQEKQDVTEQRDKFHSKSVFHVKEMFDLQGQTDKLKGCLQESELRIKELQKKLTRLQTQKTGKGKYPNALHIQGISPAVKNQQSAMAHQTAKTKTLPRVKKP